MGGAEAKLVLSKCKFLPLPSGGKRTGVVRQAITSRTILDLPFTVTYPFNPLLLALFKKSAFYSLNSRNIPDTGRHVDVTGRVALGPHKVVLICIISFVVFLWRKFLLKHCKRLQGLGHMF